MNKWPNNDAEEIGEIRENKKEKKGNRFVYKLRVFLKDDNEEMWADASHVAKDAPIMVAKYLIDKELTSKPGWEDVWKKNEKCTGKTRRKKIVKIKTNRKRDLR